MATSTSMPGELPCRGYDPAAQSLCRSPGKGL